MGPTPAAPRPPAPPNCHNIFSNGTQELPPPFWAIVHMRVDAGRAAQDDTVIMSMVGGEGPKWTVIAEAVIAKQKETGQLRTRTVTGKMCRERYQNCLDPALNHGPWTVEEQAVLLRVRAPNRPPPRRRRYRVPSRRYQLNKLEMCFCRRSGRLAINGRRSRST